MNTKSMSSAERERITDPVQRKKNLPALTLNYN